MKSPWDVISVLIAERGIGKQALAKIAGVGPSAVTKWARGGSIRAAHIEAIAAHLGLPTEVLYGRPAAQAPPSASSAASADAAPPVGVPCRYPADCDLKADLAQLLQRLADQAGELADIKTLLVSLLAEERRRDAAALAPPPAGGVLKAG